VTVLPGQEYGCYYYITTTTTTAVHDVICGSIPTLAGGLRMKLRIFCENKNPKWTPQNCKSKVVLLIYTDQ
jgi:hypothetical protein